MLLCFLLFMCAVTALSMKAVDLVGFITMGGQHTDPDSVSWSDIEAGR